MQIFRRVCIFILFTTASFSVIAAMPRFALTGLTDAKVETFFLKLQHAVDTHDVKRIATMISYPPVVNGKATVLSSDYFKKHYNDIFTKNVVAAVRRQKYGSLFGNDQGVMIGNGELWFSGVCRDASCNDPHVRIVAIKIV